MTQKMGCGDEFWCPTIEELEVGDWVGYGQRGLVPDERRVGWVVEKISIRCFGGYEPGWRVQIGKWHQRDVPSRLLEPWMTSRPRAKK